MEVEFATGCFKAVLEKYADPIVKKIKDFSEDFWNEFKIDFDIAFKKYTEKSYEKYSRVKTIIYRTEPKPFYDFFEAPTLLSQHAGCIKTENVNNILKLSHFIIIQGTGGIGKSMLMKHLFLKELEQNNLIPIFLELKEVNSISNWKIDEIIQMKLEDLGYSLDKKYLDYALKSGCFLFLLDGCDEIVSEKKPVFLREVESFCDRYENNCYIISSRPYSEFIEFQRFTLLETCRFTKQQALSLIGRLDYDKDIKEKFLIALDKKLYKKHESFASNPLLLNIMLLTFSDYAEIPEKLHIFYANAFDTMYSKHDATKAGFKREWKSSLPIDVFKKVFAEFCLITYSKMKIEFTNYDLETYISTILKRHELASTRTDDYINDLMNALCVLYRDGMNYRFTHRSFQEYFTAVFLSQLSDEQMKKLSLKLLRDEIDRAIFDSVFDMLYDINTVRFENNILIPILEECEIERGNEDKYDFYFKKIYTKIMFRFRYDGDKIERHSSGASLGNNAIGFVKKFIRHYFGNISANKEVENDIIKYLVEKIPATEIADYLADRNTKLKEIRFTVPEIKKERDVYNLLKKTWLGIQVENLSNFYELLLDRQQKKDTDFAQLLDL